MLDLKLGDKTYSVPATWREVTLGQFKKILSPLEGKDPLTYNQSILIGIDYDLLFNSVRPRKQNDLLIEIFSFTAALPDWFIEPIPKKFIVGDKELDFRSIDIEEMTTGQYNVFITEAAINPMRKDDKFYINIHQIDTAIAVYLYPQWSGKPFSDKWREMLPEIEKLPFLPCFAVASFFLNRFNKTPTTGAKSFRAPQHKKKSRQGSKSSRSSGSSMRSTR